MLTHHQLLEVIAEEKKYTLVSTGMSTMKDIEKAVKIFRKHKCPFELMHTNSSYPMIIEEANLSLIEKLKNKFKIVMLSNGEHSYLEKLAAENIGIEFDSIYSAETAGQFKPHPSVYRLAANSLNLEPNEIMMVAAHSFDILGARHSGYRGAYVDRYTCAHSLFTMGRGLDSTGQCHRLLAYI